MRGPLFLARRTYRRRRLTDAMRLLPFLGGFLIFLPMLWGEDGSDLRQTGSDGMYLFIVWLYLIIIAGLLARRLGKAEEAVANTGDES